MHFFQSDYARDFLRLSDTARYHPLSDYTDQDFVHRSLIASERTGSGHRRFRRAVLRIRQV